MTTLIIWRSDLFLVWNLTSVGNMVTMAKGYHGVVVFGIIRQINQFKVVFPKLLYASGDSSNFVSERDTYRCLPRTPSSM